MESLIDNIRTEVGKYKILIQLCTGLISILTAILSVIASLLHSPFNIAIVCIGFFFINLAVCNKLISSKRESFGMSVDKLSFKQIRIAKRIILFSYFLWLIPLYLGIDYLITRNSNCNSYKNSIGIIITSFTNSNDDDFSYKLFKVLDTELEPMDTINAVRSPKFVDAGSKSYQDTIGLLFNQSCYERGLLVFGKRSEQSKLFDCSIYINNILNFNEPILVQKKKIINLQNPDIINFSIEDQAITVSEFILGLLYYTSNNFSLSSKKFQHCSELISNQENKKLKSQCALFIGNGFFKENEYISAIKQYQLGISCDPNNAYLHFNLATAFLNSGDSLEAYQQYIAAANLNSKLINPLEELIPHAKLPKDERVISNVDGIVKQPLDFKGAAKLNKIESQVSNIDQNEYEKLSCGNKFGVIYNKDTIIKCAYDYVDPTVIVYKNKLYFIVGNYQKFGAFNKFGNIEVPIKYDSISQVKALITNHSQ